jgi:Mannosyltransferase (PIG-V)
VVTATVTEPVDETISPAQTHKNVPWSSWLNWYEALKRVLPIFISTHLAFLLLTYLAALFTLGNFSTNALDISILWNSWHHWDSAHYVFIANHGYDKLLRTAFFPLYPLLERALTFFTHNPLVAGLIISNLAGLGILVVLYRMIQEDFNTEHAFRTALYISVFPTAFFFAAAYNISLFLFLCLLSFYHIRRGHWWLAGLFGLLASLTRSVGICLLLPFCYEYLRQHQFKLHTIRLDIVSGLGIPAGIGIFAIYCYFRFHDLLAFSHAENFWQRHLHGPWHGLIDSSLIILHRGLLSFDSIHNVLDLSASLFMLGLIILGFVGPWKFPREKWVYGFYAVLIFLFYMLIPTDGSLPLESYSRYMLEVFPAFIVLAAIGKKQQFNLYYLMLSVSILSFMVLQFVTGHWIA